MIPEEYEGRRFARVNHRLRVLKYDNGMHHADHTDRVYAEGAVASALTIQIYLNDGFEGGRTTFISDRLVPVEPGVGRAIIFDHGLYHRGGMLLGTDKPKYSLRLDILYTAASEAARPPKGRQQQTSSLAADRNQRALAYPQWPAATDAVWHTHGKVHTAQATPKELNKLLSAKLRSALPSTAYAQLKALGSTFQKGGVGVEEYYQTLTALIPDAELLALMIDAMPASQAGKRDALRRLHRLKE